MARPDDEHTRGAHFLQGVRRDSGPLGLSLLLHLVALLLIAPWLVVRSVPAPEVAVEVMLEPDTATQAKARPDRAARQRAPVRAQSPQAQPLILKTVEVQLEVQRQTETTARAGQGAAGQRAVAHEAAGLAAPRAGSTARASRAPAQGATAWVRSATRPSPLAPSVGSTPQPSSTHRMVQARPGEDRRDGAVKLAGPVPESQAAQPEFRQAARQGGHQSLAGGSRAPADALSRFIGLPQESALVAATAAPQSQPGGSGALGGIQPRVAAALSSGTPAPSTARAGVTGQSPVREGLNRLVGIADPRMIGSGAAPVARALGGSGLSSMVARGPGSGGAPGERSQGTLVASPGTQGAGNTVRGGGPGASSVGSGRSTQGSGSSLAGRDTATLLAASGSGLTQAALEGGQGRLSARADDSVLRAQPSSESRTAAVQAHTPEGEARVIEERFTSTALKVDSPTSICELPLMFAGLDRKPIPQGLDTINVAGAPLAGEIPPRHQPGNQSPRYPMQALGQRAEGRVLVRAEIRSDGGVGKHWVKQGSGFDALDQAALDTVRSWRFVPAQRHGMATAMWMDVPIEYKVPK